MNSPQPSDYPPAEPLAADAPLPSPIVRRKYLYKGEPFFQPVPHWLWFFVAAGLIWACFSPNPGQTVGSFLILPVLCSLLLFKGEPSALLFACVMQWIQATSAVYYCNLKGVSLAYNDLDLGGVKAEEAVWLSMIAVVTMAMGMRAALIHWSRGWIEQARQEARLIQTDRASVLYLVSFGVSALVSAIAPHIPRVAQPLMALAMIRWMMLFLFAYAVIETRRHYSLLAVVVALEIVIGFAGFFADFKSVFFLLLVVLSGGSLAFKGWRFLLGTVLAGSLILFGLFWTAIKADYRQSLNEGSQEQRVLVPLRQRFATLLELTRSIGPAELKDAAENMALRLSTSKFFALTIENVPAYVPYEHGRLWWGAIRQTFMPRLLFPHKREIYDSLESIYYTGEDVAGPEEGNSMGIGYCAESYVDFGPIGMFLPVFLLGVYYGLIYRSFVIHSVRKIFAFSIVASLMFSCAFALETTNSILLGRVAVYSLAMAFFIACLGGQIWDFLTASPQRKLARKSPGHQVV